MDLTSDQIKRIDGYLTEWAKDPKFELETSFGAGGVVESNTFLEIAKRLRSKGYEEQIQEDYLNIITPANIRFSLQGLGVLQQYCRDDTMDGKEFTAMIKDRAVAESNLDHREYDFRIKIRREEVVGREDPEVKQMMRQWNTQKKAFRVIRRWSFKGKGVRYDLSIVRQTPTAEDGRGQFQWASTFLQHSVLSEAPRYEVEVELLHNCPETATLELARSTMIRGIGEVLRAIQKNSLLITKSTKAAVIASYQTIVHTANFRGVSPITLQVQNMTSKVEEGVPNVRKGYNVTDKADGLRALGYCNSMGEFFLIDQSMNVYRTGLENKACANSLIDGEWVTKDNDEHAINHYLIFDIYYFTEGVKVSQLPFITTKEGVVDRENGENRYSKMHQWYNNWGNGEKIIAKGVTPTNRLIILLKRFEFAEEGDSIFRVGCTNILNERRIYHTDGLILTSNSEPLPEAAGKRFDHQFKWKPSKDNTIDFLVRFEKEGRSTNDTVRTIIHSGDGRNILCKTMRLYVGSARINPRTVILMNEAIAKDEESASRYKPALFQPIEFPDTMASTCYVPIEIHPETFEEYAMTEDSKEPITNESIVEMRYDPSREPGWRWIPSRIRHDKTERLIRARQLATQTRRDIKYKGMMNDEFVANSVWNSIHEPVTESMIRTGNEQPTDAEMKVILESRDKEMGLVYYERKAPKEDFTLIKGLLDFHNKYIKSEILIQRALKGGGKRLLDVACGKGGDLNKWTYSRPRAQYVVGIDMAGDNITNPTDGAYKRYMDIIADSKHRGLLPIIAFIIGNSAKRIVDGSAGANQEESDMLRSIFGSVAPEGPVPPYIQRDMVGSFRSGADVVSCMFALHYFFENMETLNGFLKNLDDTVKQGGLFIGCCFDGQRVFQLLQGLEMGRSKRGMEEDVPIWSITKEYEMDEFVADDSSVGLGVNVEFISIGSAHREYLVNFDYLKSRMEDMGFHLLTPEELEELDLKQSTSTFDISYGMAEKAGKKYKMLPAVQQFSFLNRWFIFKRGEEIGVPEVPVSAPEVEEVIEVPVEESSAPEAPAAPAAPASAIRPLQDVEVFRIGPTVTMNSKFKTIFRDDYAGRWLALNAPFPIVDPNDQTTIYPSIEHYMIGRMFTLISNHPELAKFASKDGKIHQKFLGIRQRDEQFDPKWKDDREIPAKRVERHFELLDMEDKEIRNLIPAFLRRKGTQLDMTQWNAIDPESGIPLKDKELQYALQYRKNHDPRYNEIVEKARNAGKYLLYISVRRNESELGGVLVLESNRKQGKIAGTIEGENKVGKMIMKLYNFPF